MRSSFCSCTPCQQTARSSFWSPSEALFPSALALALAPPARSKTPTMTQNVTHTANRSLRHSAPAGSRETINAATLAPACMVERQEHSKRKKAMMGAACHRKKVRILELFRGHFGPLRTDCTHPTARSSSYEHYGSSRAQRPHSQRLNFSHKGVSTLNIELLNWCFDERYYDSANGRSISPLRDR